MFAGGFGLPFNHSLYRPVEDWPKLNDWIMGDAPGPHQKADETPEVLRQQAQRISDTRAVLRHVVDQSRPDVLLVLASDRGRLFSAVQVPQIWIYTGQDELWGSSRLAELDEPAAEDIIRFKAAPNLAGFIREELAYHGFDLSYGEKLRPMFQPDYGLDASVVNAVRFLRPALDIPVVPILLNTQLQPMPNGQRCRALGKALAAMIEERPERVAVVASGGLWHDHHGSRAGFVDEKLDEWLLKTLERGLSERIEPLFAVNSDTGFGGVAEMRLWATLGAVCESFGAKSVTVDYFPSYTAGAGMGFAYWPGGSAGAH